MGRFSYFAEPGDTVTFLGRNGRDAELAHAMSRFTVGQRLVVSVADIRDSSSDYTFEGAEGCWNTVMFSAPESSLTESSIESVQTGDLGSVKGTPDTEHLISDAKRERLESAAKALEQIRLVVADYEYRSEKFEAIKTIVREFYEGVQ